MDIQKLRYFVSVAETNNFTSAAERNFISQPALSRHISDLEYQLGFKLFNRSKTSVSLTPEGELFLDSAKELLNMEDNLENQARSLSQSRVGFLKIGYWGYWEISYVSQVVRNFSHKHPYTDFTFSRENHGKLNRRIQKGDYDLVFSIIPPQKDAELYPNVRWQPLAQSQLFAFIPNGHWLSNRNQVTFRDLENEKQIILAKDCDSVFSTAVAQGFLEEGVSCNYYPYYPDNALDALLLVSAGKCISLSTKWQKRMNMPGVKAIPLVSSIGPLEFGIAYRTDRQNELIQSFVHTAKNTPKELFDVPDDLIS